MKEGGSIKSGDTNTLPSDTSTYTDIKSTQLFNRLSKIDGLDLNKLSLMNVNKVSLRPLDILELNQETITSV